MQNTVIWLLGILLILAVLAGIGFFLYYAILPLMRLWIKARLSNASIGILDLVKIRMRDPRRDPIEIVEPLIKARQAGLIDVDIDKLEELHLAGGHIDDVVRALIASKNAGIALPFSIAQAIDLAGRDVLEAVRDTITPRIIEVPDVASVAQNGIQLIVKARITARANIDKLVGGAGEDTLKARVGQAIVTAIGLAKTHQELLENPDTIAKMARAKGDELDKDTAFNVLSIDIADIDIGKNIGAELEREKAQADKDIAQAEAEKRRAMAIALEQEMKAKAEEARAMMLQAEAEIPIAIAEAFRAGKINVNEYYQYKNIKADTEMRESFSKANTQSKSQPNQNQQNTTQNPNPNFRFANPEN